MTVRSSLSRLDQFKRHEEVPAGMQIAISADLKSRSRIPKKQIVPHNNPGKMNHHHDNRWFVAPRTIIAIRPTVVAIQKTCETPGLRITSSLSFAVTRDHSRRFLSLVRFDNSATTLAHIGSD